jgi:hypothetical protein
MQAYGEVNSNYKILSFKIFIFSGSLSNMLGHRIRNLHPESGSGIRIWNPESECKSGIRDNFVSGSGSALNPCVSAIRLIHPLLNVRM